VVMRASENNGTAVAKGKLEGLFGKCGSSW
jgi:hypothetical protein